MPNPGFTEEWLAKWVGHSLPDLTRHEIFDLVLRSSKELGTGALIVAASEPSSRPVRWRFVLSKGQTRTVGALLEYAPPFAPEPGLRRGDDVLCLDTLRTIEGNDGARYARWQRTLLQFLAKDGGLRGMTAADYIAHRWGDDILPRREGT